MIEFRLPSLGADMDEGKLLEWRVEPGDAVKKGQVVCVVDTAKAAIDVECWHDGTVQRLLVEPGTTIPVGTPMAVLREPGETIEAVERQLAALREPAAPVAVPAPKVPQAPAEAPAAPAAAERRRISPAARRRAQALSLDPARIAGSGPQGEVTLADVEAAAMPGRAPPPAAPPIAGKAPAAPTSRAQQMRAVIAAAMARSKREIPHYYLTEEVPLIAASAWLAQKNAQRGVADRLLMAALQLKAVAVALQRYPDFNGYWRDGAFAPGAGVHLGVAISLREGGLVAPALHDVPSMDIGTLTRALLDLVRRTRAGQLRSSELSDATITVTNLGDQGVASVLGVIYPPQVALVGFGRIAERPWAIDGALRAAPVVTASLAADHRAGDGHRGGRFLAAIGEALQAPEDLDRIVPQEARQ
jgi:pyruvate dehydrogenase E2 component (dihydrolipoamide acetyltransferase)